jgi:hypothetical protein
MIPRQSQQFENGVEAIDYPQVGSVFEPVVD